ncbi:MAG: phage GP46 family protein [Candidatus Pacebacteria bacterium]|nr:phage GP46 family protein [Candidatus Paceibacterota bacterium]
MVDLALIDGDLAIINGDLAVDDGIATAIVLSLFSDRRASPAELMAFARGSIVSDDPRGWPLETVAGETPRRFGSRIWLLTRDKQTDETRRAVIDAAAEALAWLKSERLVKAVAVDGVWRRPELLELTVTVTRTDGVTQSYFYSAGGKNV